MTAVRTVTTPYGSVDINPQRWTDVEVSLIQAGLCPWQTSYGMPGMTYCREPGTPMCAAHDRMEREAQRASGGVLPYGNAIHTGTVSVQVFHNVDRDPSGRPVGMMDGFQPQHPVSPVAELRLPAPNGFQRVCDDVFNLFNVGDDPDFGTPDPVAIAYRERGNRSLSVGDVVRVADTWYACQRVGWALIDPPRVVPVTDVPGTFTLLLMLPAEAWPATPEATP